MTQSDVLIALRETGHKMAAREIIAYLKEKHNIDLSWAGVHCNLNALHKWEVVERIYKGSNMYHWKIRKETKNENKL